MNPFTKQSRRTDIENKSMVTKGERQWERINEEFGINRSMLLLENRQATRMLLYNTENNIQYLIIIYNGK